jgi:hypothetical protein
MLDNVGYDGYTTYMASNGEYPYAPGTSGRPLTKEDYDRRTSYINYRLKEKEAEEKGINISGNISGNMYGGKIKLPKKSVKRMSKVK